MSKDEFTGLVMSGTVLAISRHTNESIKVAVRDTKGLIYEIMFPFNVDAMSKSLPFNIDDMVGVSIGKLPEVEGPSI